MGTRNLTFVTHKGEIRMAQYGQFDGYMEGVGKDIANTLKKTTTEKLREAIEQCVFIDDEKVEQYYRDAGSDGSGLVTLDVSDRFKAAHPFLHRDCSGGLALRLLLETKGPIELCDNREFAADSLFCEWAYVVDLDNERVEVYKGFNQKPLPKNARFANMKAKETRRGETYYPVRLWKSFSFANFVKKFATE